jgi:hypothetical protein
MDRRKGRNSLLDVVSRPIEDRKGAAFTDRQRIEIEIELRP